MSYQFLDWDSEFFGIKVARITTPNLSEEMLRELLQCLKHEGANLVYWPSTAAHSAAEITQLSGLLVDIKTTYYADLALLNIPAQEHSTSVEPYTESMNLDTLEELAIQSGELSRFAVDSRIPRAKFETLYKTWINKSVKKIIAQEVLVIRDQEQIAGMVTLGEKNKRGDIGLIAVDQHFRGRKYGEQLVRAAQHWFLENSYQHVQVVTQGQNIAANRLYLKCGYTKESSEHFYHFWL